MGPVCPPTPLVLWGIANTQLVLMLGTLWGVLRTMGTGVLASEGLRELGDCGQEAAPGSRGSGAGGLLVASGVGVLTTVHCLQLLGPSGLWGQGGQAWPLIPSPSNLSPLLVSPCRKRAAACASGSGCTPRCGRAPSC